MPILGVNQPEEIIVDEKIRLRKYDGKYEVALDWYQDRETLLLVDGKDDPYNMERLAGMYSYLDEQGELYFIEYKMEQGYQPIGDVTFWKEDMPIVIGEPSMRGKHIGGKVVHALIERAKELGYECIYVDEIYEYNTGSRRCFEAAGFQAYEKTEKGNRYCLKLT